MHITLVDDSIPFDGYSASSRPLGGAEKAFGALPGALARRGHSVQVFNRCRWGMFIEGAQWETFDGRKPLRTDVLVAFRKPSLLEFVRQSSKRVLWFTGPARMLEQKGARSLLDAHKPLVVLTAATQAKEWSASRGAAVQLMPPAVRPDFQAGEPKPVSPPRAIVTTHPAHGMDWLLDLWIGRIRPACPTAELHLHSMMLSRAADGAFVEGEERPLVDKAMAAEPHGVVIVRPQGDYLMADAFREASVHLYPGHPDDMCCFTLMESQAAGLPAVLRPLGAAPERVADGRSGFVAPDDDAFANLAIMLLNEEAVRRSASAEARALYKERTWEAAAERFEAMLA